MRFLTKGLSAVAILAIINLVPMTPWMACAQQKADKMKAKPAAAGREPGAYATLDTSMGRIVCRLYGKETPKTVANFIGLAQGTKEWKNPRNNEKVKRPLFNGLVFHRVIPNFMIQGGDPLGNGRGGPGYDFEDEIVATLKFDRPGKLAMANRGPNTNGSQFFITVAATPHLNGRHTIFGAVIEGMDVATAIANTPRDLSDKPKTAVVIKTVTIEHVK